MFNHLPVRNLIGLQRVVAWKRMGEHARELLSEGYGVDADRVLDEMVRLRAEWSSDRWGIDGGAR